MRKTTAIGEVDECQRSEPDEQVLAARLAARDREARAREMQRRADAGALAAGIEYVYETGPDGSRHAVGGKIRIIVPPDQTPDSFSVAVQPLRPAANPAADPDGQNAAAIGKPRWIAPGRAEPFDDLPSLNAPTCFGGLDQTA
jgi:hypothetical protein